jgi:SAM-dependent methyltransferase
VTTPDRSAIESQRQHWQRTFAANPDMYGTQASEPGRYAVDLFTRERRYDVLELGAGRGRDTFAFLAAGFNVTALDYESASVLAMRDGADSLGVADRFHVTSHDVREPLPYADANFDAVYSHILFSMALTANELDLLADQVCRVLRPDGLHVYTVRHVGDAHYEAGASIGDGMYENGGFIVHFFDRALVERLASGLATPNSWLEVGRADPAASGRALPAAGPSLATAS